MKNLIRLFLFFPWQINFYTCKTNAIPYSVRIRTTKRIFTDSRKSSKILAVLSNHSMVTVNGHFQNINTTII